METYETETALVHLTLPPLCPGCGDPACLCQEPVLEYEPEPVACVICEMNDVLLED